MSNHDIEDKMTRSIPEILMKTASAAENLTPENETDWLFGVMEASEAGESYGGESASLEIGGVKVGSSKVMSQSKLSNYTPQALRRSQSVKPISTTNSDPAHGDFGSVISNPVPESTGDAGKPTFRKKNDSTDTSGNNVDNRIITAGKVDNLSETEFKDYGKSYVDDGESADVRNPKIYKSAPKPYNQTANEFINIISDLRKKSVSLVESVKVASTKCGMSLSEGFDLLDKLTLQVKEGHRSPLAGNYKRAYYTVVEDIPFSGSLDKSIEKASELLSVSKDIISTLFKTVPSKVNKEVIEPNKSEVEKANKVLEVKQGMNLVRDTLSAKLYKKSFVNLSNDQKREILDKTKSLVKKAIHYKKAGIPTDKQDAIYRIADDLARERFGKGILSLTDEQQKPIWEEAQETFDIGSIFQSEKVLNPEEGSTVESSATSYSGLHSGMPSFESKQSAVTLDEDITNINSSNGYMAPGVDFTNNKKLKEEVNNTGKPNQNSYQDASEFKNTNTKTAGDDSKWNPSKIPIAMANDYLNKTFLIKTNKGQVVPAQIESVVPVGNSIGQLIISVDSTTANKYKLYPRSVLKVKPGAQFLSDLGIMGFIKTSATSREQAQKQWNSYNKDLEVCKIEASKFTNDPEGFCRELKSQAEGKINSGLEFSGEGTENTSIDEVGTLEGKNVFVSLAGKEFGATVEKVSYDKFLRPTSVTFKVSPDTAKSFGMAEDFSIDVDESMSTLSDLGIKSIMK